MARKKTSPRAGLRGEALDVLMTLLRVDNPSGREGKIARTVRALLRDAGVPARHIRFDDANRRIPGGGEVGNLVVRLPGAGSLAKAPRRLFAAHLDSVPLALGVRPVLRGNRIRPAGKTALGADDRAGVSALVTALRRLWRSGREHPPVTFLFTVQEEGGLRGAHYCRTAGLGRPALGFSYDSSDPGMLVIGAPSSDVFTIRVRGRAAHAGVHPEDGVSATAIFASAAWELVRKGWFGRVRKGQRTGVANIGTVSGAGATNIVTELVEARGEARSHDERFLARIVDEYRRTFERAARNVRSVSGRTGKIEFRKERVYAAFRLAERAPVVREAVRALAVCGIRRPEMNIQFGGLDANWLNAHGIPTVTLGCGQHGMHSLEEYLDVREFLLGCRVAGELAAGG